VRLANIPVTKFRNRSSLAATRRKRNPPGWFGGFPEHLFSRALGAFRDCLKGDDILIKKR
jgi:hypothetical protein